MTSDVQAVQARLDEAEREICALEPVGQPEIVVRWARDRLRLVARDRATLERHTLRREAADFCPSCIVAQWPCDIVQVVIDYWLDGTREGEAK